MKLLDPVGVRPVEHALLQPDGLEALGAELPHRLDGPLYAALWESRQGPWENGDFRGPGSGLFKSTDAGATWSATRRTCCRVTGSCTCRRGAWCSRS